MDKNAKKEFTVLAIVIIFLLSGVLFGAQVARQERRDGKVRDDLRDLKHQVEMYFNENGQYPLEWNAGNYKYVVVEAGKKGAIKWYVSGKLENKTKPSFGVDQEYNIEWRVTESGNYEICGGNYRCEN